ncbi:MAG: MoxR family ATPase [Pseudomonadota bacterium]
MDANKRAEAFAARYAAIIEEMRKVIVGQDEVIAETLTALFAGGHALIEGVPGLGKTRLVQALSDCLDLTLSRIQFTPDLMPADVIGTNIIVETESGRAFRFEPGPVFGNLLLADEINRATPKTQSALLEAMQESAVTVSGERHSLGEPFFVVATQNPIEIEGTYLLPEAQLDRFLFKINVPFPDVAALEDIMVRTTGNDEPSLSIIADASAIGSMKELVREVPIPNSVRTYVAQLVLATHPDSEFAPASVRQAVRHGASPRGAQALILSGKVQALLDGRFNVALKDIQKVTHPSLRHRMILNFEGEADGVSTETLVDDILAAVPSDT